MFYIVEGIHSLLRCRIQLERGQQAARLTEYHTTEP